MYVSVCLCACFLSPFFVISHLFSHLRPHQRLRRAGGRQTIRHPVFMWVKQSQRGVETDWPPRYDAGKRRCRSWSELSATESELWGGGGRKRLYLHTLECVCEPVGGREDKGVVVIQLICKCQANGKLCNLQHVNWQKSLIDFINLSTTWNAIPRKLLVEACAVLFLFATLLLFGRCLLDLYTPAEEQTGIQEDSCKLQSLMLISHSSSCTVAECRENGSGTMLLSTTTGGLFTASGSRHWKEKAAKRKLYLWSPLPFFWAPDLCSLAVTRREALDCVLENWKTSYNWLTSFLKTAQTETVPVAGNGQGLRRAWLDWWMRGFSASRKRWQPSASCQKNEWPPIVEVNRFMPSINCFA